MKAIFPSLNALWAGLVVEELVRCGVTRFIVCPGSRSTALVLAAAAHSNVQALVHYDERGAGFFAVGYARATGRPMAVITTSGTAVANLLPAVVEASQSRLPLLLLTADRPPELHDTGANQTIRQRSIFGPYVRWEFDVPCPGEDIPPRFVLTTVDEAVCRAGGHPPGPVHLNLMFREPLAPPPGKRSFRRYLAPVTEWLQAEGPFTRHRKGEAVVSDDVVAETAADLQANCGLVVVGRLPGEPARRAVARLVGRMGWPVLADIGSGLRLGARNLPVVPHLGLMLEATGGKLAFHAEAILHLGDPVISKTFLSWLEQESLSRYIHIGDHPYRQDPAHRVTHSVETDVALFCRQLAARMSPRGLSSAARRLFKVNRRIEHLLGELLDTHHELDEPTVARLSAKHVSTGGAVFLGSSMPIRDVGMFAHSGGTRVLVAANRGASGIDGTFASAAGFAAGLKRSVTALMGDVAALHDLNSLALLRRVSPQVIAVVINNDGGGIFHFLPVRRHRERFEAFFAAPHGRRLEEAARMFDLAYACPATSAEFIDTYRRMRASGGPALIEVLTDRRANYRLHQALYRRVAELCQDLGG